MCPTGGHGRPLSGLGAPIRLSGRTGNSNHRVLPADTPVSSCAQTSRRKGSISTQGSALCGASTSAPLSILLLGGPPFISLQTH